MQAVASSPLALAALARVNQTPWAGGPQRGNAPASCGREVAAKATQGARDASDDETEAVEAEAAEAAAAEAEEVAAGAASEAAAGAAIKAACAAGAASKLEPAERLSGEVQPISVAAAPTKNKRSRKKGKRGKKATAATPAIQGEGSASSQAESGGSASLPGQLSGEIVPMSAMFRALAYFPEDELARLEIEVKRLREDLNARDQIAHFQSSECTEQPEYQKSENK